MTLDELRGKLEASIQEGNVKPEAMAATNILNAEYALGKYFAFLQIIAEMYGIETMARIRDDYKDKEAELMDRANKIYEGRLL